MTIEIIAIPASEAKSKVYDHNIAFFIGDKAKYIYGEKDGSPKAFASELLHFVQTHSYADVLAMVEKGDENVETQGSAIDVLNGKTIGTKCQCADRSTWDYTFFYEEGRKGSKLNVHHVTKDGICLQLERYLSTLSEQDFVDCQAMGHMTKEEAENTPRELLVWDEVNYPLV